MTHEETLSLQWPCSSDFRRFAVHETFVLSNYANSVSQFLLYWMRIWPVSNVVLLPCRTKLIESNSTLARQKRVWNQVVLVPCSTANLAVLYGGTWVDPSVGHLNGILVRVGGNLSNNFQKSQMPGMLPRGDFEASIWPIHQTSSWSSS